MLKKIVKKSMLFLQAQLIAALVSLPILVAWGIPVSKASLLGNLIFWPILTIFLIISSALFFLEIFSIPNFYLIGLLNRIASFWQKLLSFGQVSWLTGFSKPAIIILFLIFISIFLVLSFKRIKTVNTRICALALLFFISTAFLYSIQIIAGHKELNYQDKLVITLSHDGSVSIVDFGIFKRKRAIDKFLNFELKPYIIKNFGTLKVKELDLRCNYSNNCAIRKEFNKTFQV